MGPDAAGAGEIRTKKSKLLGSLRAVDIGKDLIAKLEGLWLIGVRLREVRFSSSGRLLVFFGAVSGSVFRGDRDSPVALEAVQGALQYCRSQQSLALTLTTG